MEEGDSSLSQSRAFYATLLRAALQDDWEAAEAFIQKNPDCLGAPITEEKGTALHNAAAAKHTRFVKKLVKLMKPEQLEVKTKHNCTALYFAAQSEIVTIAEVMVNKNKDLPSIFPEDHIEFLPLYAAIETGNRDMVSYLYSVTPIQDLASLDHIDLLNATISTDLYDTAHKILDILKPAPEEKEYLWLSLKMLAKKPPEIIGNKSQASVWERCLNSCFRGRFCNKALMRASAHKLVDRLWKQCRDDIYFSSTAIDDDKHMMKVLVEATKVGNLEFLIILIRSYPDLIWQVDKEYGSLFHIAVKHRQESVFNLIYETGVMKTNIATYIDKEGNNMLHLAAKLPSSDRLNIVSGAALQMQQELLWFQEIKKIVPKSILLKDMEKTEKPPKDIFVSTHKELQKNGEKWMRGTANSCMLVATLIATVVFPAAFTVPGGNNQETGIPIFLESNWFTLFLVSDAIAMLFSSSSIFVFLTILMSRYTEKDFLKSLPRRLVLGLTMLLISIVGMLIAFSAACILVFKSKTSVPIRISTVAAPIVPISLFVILDYGLWVDIFCSAFCSDRFLFRSQNRLFNPSCQQRLLRKLRMTIKLDIMKELRFLIGLKKRGPNIETS